MDNEYKITAWGRSYNPPNWFCNPSYLINRIYYICSGTAYYCKTIPLKPGFLYIMKANPDFEVSQDPNDPVDHVYFDFLLYQKILTVDFMEIDLSEQPLLSNIVIAAMSNFAEPSLPWHIADSYFDILYHNLAQYFTARNNFSYITADSLRYIHQTDIENLSVLSIAEAVNANVNHVIRCFKKNLGITPHKYIAMLKSDMAIHYLRQGLSISEAAAKLGFESVSSFSTFFKNETHKNLSDFKQ